MWAGVKFKMRDRLRRAGIDVAGPNFVFSVREAIDALHDAGVTMPPPWHDS